MDITWPLVCRITGWEHLFTEEEKSVRNSPEDWFWYFFEEAKYVASQGLGAKYQPLILGLLDQYFEINTRPAQNDHRILKQRLAGPKQTAWMQIQSRLEPEKLKQSLTKLLVVGFKCLSTDDTALDWSNAIYLDKQRYGFDIVGAESALQRGEVRDIPRGQARLVWRSEGNISFENRRRSLEIDARVDIAEKKVAYKMSERWHPFSEANICKHFWFRPRQGDNELQTVVSTGSSENWRNVISFPKLDQAPPTFEVDAEWVEVKKMFGHAGLVDVQPGPGSSGRIRLRAVRVIMMFFLLEGKMMMTGELGRGNGEAFPEVGIKKIPPEKIFLLASVVRVHHGPRDEFGFTVFLEKYEYICKRGDTWRRINDMRPNLQEQISRISEQAIREMKANPYLAWAPGGVNETYEAAMLHPDQLGADNGASMRLEIGARRVRIQRYH
jgi:hypothetical protein